jgi:hypothetical protein
VRISLWKLLFAKPWAAGLLCALIPVCLLWGQYPLTWNSVSTKGRITGVAIVQRDQLTNTGSQGVADLACYEMHVVFEFTHDRIDRRGTQIVKSCDLFSLKKQAKLLDARDAVVIYDTRQVERAFLPALIARSELKLTAALTVAFFVLGTWIAGRLAGRYTTGMLNVSFNEIPPKFIFLGILFIFFYTWLLLV